MREQPDISRPATPGDHTYLIDPALLAGEQGTLRLVYVPEGWMVEELSRRLTQNGMIEYRVRLTPP